MRWRMVQSLSSYKSSTLSNPILWHTKLIACTYSEWIKVERAINSDLLLVDKWYYLNNLERNKAKYEAIVMGKRWNKLTFRCENAIIHINSSLKILGVNINDLLKFDNHLFKISRKVLQQIVVARHLKKLFFFLSKLDVICIYLSMLRMLNIVLNHGTFVAKVLLTN